MVLPELSRTMAYTACNIVNRIKRRVKFKSCGTRKIKGERDLYIEPPKTLRTFVRKFSNIDFFPKILPLKDDELVMSEM